MRLRAGFVMVVGLSVVGCPGREARVEVPAASPSASAATSAASTATSATATASVATATGNPPAPPTVPKNVQTWRVLFPSSNPRDLRWGCSASALCFRLEEMARGFGVADPKTATCPSVIQVPQGCTPGAACFPEERDVQVNAPLVASVSKQESAKGAACCFEEPSHCIPPNAGAPAPR